MTLGFITRAGAVRQVTSGRQYAEKVFLSNTPTVGGFPIRFIGMPPFSPKGSFASGKRLHGNYSKNA